ncbi:MAG: CHASE2 domain-containing protein [Alphaproteobacteria bacterium]
MSIFKRALPHLLVVVIVLSAHFFGALAPIRNIVGDWRFDVLSRPVSGEIVIVGIDPKSLDAVGVWPWPRRLHAQLLEKLQAAGAAEIVFDIDFSSASTPEDDAIFETALAASKGSVILPIFRQSWSASNPGEMKATRPLERFARYSWPASVAVPAQNGGLIRIFPYGDYIDGVFVPSIPAFFGANAVRSGDSFYVDFSIQPQTLKRISYIDVLEGRVAPSDLAGKKIIVGANAVELRDNFSVPVYGVISGPMLQALSTESIIQNRALSQTSDAASLAGLGAIVLLTILLLSHLRWRQRQIVLLALIICIEVAALGTQWLAPIIVDTSAWLVAIIAYIVITMMREVNFRRLMEAIAHTQHINTQATLDRVISDNFDGILIANSDGQIETASRVTAGILGLDPTKMLVGLELKQVLPAGLADQACVAIDTMDQANVEITASSTREIEFTGADGCQRIVDYVMTPSQLADDVAPKGKQGGQGEKIITITIRDVTKIRQADRDMRQAAKTAISANQSKTDFLATMSHELRTPLNAIIGFSDLMKQELYGPLGNPEYTGFVEQINSSGSRLLAALNSIMSMAQIESGEVVQNEDELDVTEIVDALVNRVEAELGDTNKSIAYHVPESLPLLFADQAQVEQMLSGILDNAAKFTDAGGTIKVDATVTEAGELAITVADDGIGIAPEHLGKVTQSFYQIESAHNRSHEGCGLGLTLSAAFVKSHQGRLDISSELGVGTQVTMVFPAQRAIVRVQQELPKNSYAGEYDDTQLLAEAV